MMPESLLAIRRHDPEGVPISIGFVLTYIFVQYVFGPYGAFTKWVMGLLVVGAVVTFFLAPTFIPLAVSITLAIIAAIIHTCVFYMERAM